VEHTLSILQQFLARELIYEPGDANTNGVSTQMHEHEIQTDCSPGSLHLAFFTVKFLILRALIAPATPESKTNPASKLCQHIEYALAEGAAFLRFMKQFSALHLHVFWRRRMFRAVFAFALSRLTAWHRESHDSHNFWKLLDIFILPFFYGGAGC
jgi:hypothetical protein